jgi:hypothetical protein
MFRPEPSRFAGLLAPVAVATTLAACSPSVSGPRATAPITVAHTDSSGGNRNGTGSSVGETIPAPTPSVVPVSTSQNVPIEMGVEMAGEMAF